MSSDDLFRQVPDELFRKVSKRPERGLPDAFFGPPNAPGEAAPMDVAGAEVEPVAEELPRGGSESAVHESVGSLSVGSSPADSEADQAGIELSPLVTGVESGAVAADHAMAAEALPVASTEADAAEPDDVIVDEVLPDEVLESALPGQTLDGAESAGLAEEPEPNTPEVLPADSAVSAGDIAPVDESAAGTDVAAAFDPSAEPKTTDEPHRRPVLLVIADSLAYFGPEGGLPADDPRIWPNLVAAELDWDVELIGRIGWTCRDAYWALIGDPRVWSAIPHAGAVVFAVGGMDTLPSPLPTALRELIRYLRPPGLRRRVRDTYQWLQPKLAKLGRPVALPPKVSVDYLEQSRAALAQLRAELPMVAALPSVHNCDAYGRVHRGREPAVRVLRVWSERTSVPLVDLGEAVRDNIFSGDANPDGIHWGWAGHTAVANAMTKTLYEAG